MLPGANEAIVIPPCPEIAYLPNPRLLDPTDDTLAHCHAVKPECTISQNPNAPVRAEGLSSGTAWQLRSSLEKPPNQADFWSMSNRTGNRRYARSSLFGDTVRVTLHHLTKSCQPGTPVAARRPTFIPRRPSFWSFLVALFLCTVRFMAWEHHQIYVEKIYYAYPEYLIQ